MATNINPSVLSLFGVKAATTPAAKLMNLAVKAEKPRPELVRPDPEKVLRLEYNGRMFIGTGISEAQLPELERQAIELEVFSRRSQELNRRLLNGQINPLSDEALNHVSRPREIAEKRGLLFEGRFAEGIYSGDEFVGYAQFIDRQTAMMNAYYYASNLTSDAKHYAGLANLVIFGNEPVGGEAAMFKRGVDRRTQLLAAQFGAPPQALATDAEGRISRQGFELSHDKFGRILSVDAKGVFTFYDAAGAAYDAASYVAAEPDGIIPQLVNHERYKAGKLNGRF